MNITVLKNAVLLKNNLYNNKSPCNTKREGRVIFLAVKRRKFIRTISYLAAVCVVFAASGMFSQRAKAGYEETLGKVRMSNLGSMCEYFRDISAGLRLLAVSTESSVSESISYVEARVMGARGCINGFDTEKVKNINKFLNTLNSFLQEFSGTSEKRKIAVYLSEYAQEVYYHLNDVSSAVLSGAYSLTEYGSLYKNDEKPYFEDYVDYSNGNERELFNAAAPVSAAVNTSFFEKKEDISEEKAKEIASGVTGVNSALWRNGNSDGIYSFRHGDIAVEISKSGMLCRLINPTPCRTAVLSLSEAEEKAAEFLGEYGYKGMVPMRRENGEFTASFLFYPRVNGVLLMTSPVRVEICRSSGETVYFDSYEYNANYTEKFHAPEVIYDISGILPENVTVSRSFFCVRSINGVEKLCVFTECRYDEYDYYLYIDPETMKIIKTENA